MSESKPLPTETIAYQRLKDLGIVIGQEPEASYRWATDYNAMLSAVKVV
jgi:hypothetical protein